MESKIGSCFLGRTLELTNGKIIVGVTLDVGPRIIKLQKVGGENLMFEDVDDASVFLPLLGDTPVTRGTFDA